MSKEIDEFYWIKTLSIFLLFFVHSSLLLTYPSPTKQVEYFMLSNFFFISGYLSFLSQKRGLKRFAKNRFVRLFLPFLLFLAAYGIIDWFISYFTSEFSYVSVVRVADYIYHAVLLGIFEQNLVPIYELAHLWFVPVLLAYMFLLIALEKTTHRLKIQIAVVLSLFLLNGFLFRLNSPVALSANFSLFLINFSVGFWIAKTGKLSKIQSRWTLPIAGILFFLLFLTPELISLELYWLRQSILALLATIAFVSLLSGIKSYSWVKLIAASTLMIYLSEPLIRYGVGKMFGVDFYSAPLTEVAFPMLVRILTTVFVGIAVQTLFTRATRQKQKSGH
ncbi:acyltransferase family protein [Candidatus Bathyarchaeota archaeon]|nr:acyltransferase family protein [Candidatus Bathyarchaeota archaeon]